jgi:hypothetical protein
MTRSSAAAMRCDPTYVAPPILSACSVAIGNTHRLSIKRTWTEPAILWSAIIGESGAAKSPAIETALAEVRRRQRGALKRHAEQSKEHAEALAIHARDMARWSKGDSDDAPPERPEAPTASGCTRRALQFTSLANYQATPVKKSHGSSGRPLRPLSRVRRTVDKSYSHLPA